MKLSELDFARPAALQATRSPEARGLTRDAVRLLVSTPEGHHHTHFANVANFLHPGDLLVVNRSATLPASLPAEGKAGPFILNLSTKYGPSLWLAEPRWSAAEPGPLPFAPGDVVEVAGMEAKLLSPYPGLPRLWFVQFAGTLDEAIRQHGQPIRYGYVQDEHDLDAYQTVFASVPGSAEMPSAARPFTERVLSRLTRKGVNLASIILHTGVSSLEIETDEIEQHPLYPEPFSVPVETARAVNETRANGGRVVAVGTTVVRALESAWNGQEVYATEGFTRLYLHPGRPVHVVNGLLTGFHDPKASHLAMLYAVAGKRLVQEGYAQAVQAAYLWHEFGDSHLILP
jgi:S-adenosylmethionine:tRNA ribosyltransferase-isomerase